MRFEPLGRRLKAGVAMAEAAAVGGIGGAALASGYPDREPSSTAAQELALTSRTVSRTSSTRSRADLTSTTPRRRP